MAIRSDRQENDNLTLTEFKTSIEDIAIIEEVLVSQGYSPVIIQSPEDDTALVRLYKQESSISGKKTASPNDSPTLPPTLLRKLQPWLSRPLSDCQVYTIKREDWSESWKKHFKSIRVGERLIIKPSWEDIKPESGEKVVEINPGMCFGTGGHGTTLACLRLIEKLNRCLGPNISLLDAGCGSGILSLAAAALGYQPITAFDNDPQSVRVTRDNIKKSGCRTPIEVLQAELSCFQEDRQYRVVVANILASALLENAEKLVHLLDWEKPPAFLIVSGILTRQYPDIRTAFTRLGLREIESATIDEWRSGCFSTGENVFCSLTETASSISQANADP